MIHFWKNCWKLLQTLEKFFRNDFYGKFCKIFEKPHKKCLATCRILQIVENVRPGFQLKTIRKLQDIGKWNK